MLAVKNLDVMRAVHWLEKKPLDLTSGDEID